MKTLFKKAKQLIYPCFRQGIFIADDLFYRFLLLFPSRSNQPKEKRVVFVIDHRSPRVYKIMRELYRNGWEIISFCRIKRGKDGIKIEEDITRYSSKVEQYISVHGALYRCRKYSGGLFHVFCCYTYDVPALLIKKRVGKIIFDSYDGYAGFRADWKKTKRNLKIADEERFCLENADGLTCRSFETQYNKWYMGYQFKGTRLLFLDYCSTEDRRYLHKHRLNGTPVFFYGGGLLDEINRPDAALSCMTETARILSEHGCRFLVYHTKLSDELKDYYTKVFEAIPNAELHEAVPFEEMLKIMQQCDFAIFPARGNYNDWTDGNQEDGVSFNTKHIYSAANKYFDAIETGLPMVAYIPKRFVQMLKHCGVVCCSVDDLGDKIDYLKENYDKLRGDIAKNIEKFSIEKNIKRLIDFYEKL